MKRVIITLLFLLFAAPAFATITVVGSPQCDGSTNDNNVATASQNITGANLVIGVISNYKVATSNTLSTNGGNTITLLTPNDGGTNARQTKFYIVSPTSLASFVITASTVTASYPVICYIAVTVTSGTTPFDGENNNGVSGTSGTTGSLTPSQDNDILVAVWSSGGTTVTSPSIDAGFSNPPTSFLDDTHTIPTMFSYLIETTATAENPTFSWTNSINGPTGIFAFKDTSGGGGATRRGAGGLLGVQ